MTNSEPVSDRTLALCARFGISPAKGPPTDHLDRAHTTARNLLRLPPGHIALITGPSGGGKSTIMRAIYETETPGLRRFRVGGNATPMCSAAAHPSASAGPRVIDAFPGPLGESLAALARAGLTEAHILASPLDTLSDGQRARISLAIALHRALRAAKDLSPTALRPLILADEFVSTLDRTTAVNLARTLSRCIRACRLRAVVATAHDDILEALAPDVLVYQPLRRPPMIITRGTKESDQ